LKKIIDERKHYCKIQYQIKWKGYILIYILLEASWEPRQGLLFRRYKRKPTRSINTENTLRQASSAITSEGENYNFFQIVISNPNPE
jgi:hypothetical protein